ncbi:hypothetical protein P9112_011190 [Eukaryota sp. TZLM1-RC]
MTNIRSAATQCVANSNKLPSGTNLKLSRVDQQFKQAHSSVSNQVLSLASSIASHTMSHSTEVTDDTFTSNQLSSLLSSISEQLDLAMDALRAPHRQQRQGNLTSTSFPPQTNEPTPTSKPPFIPFIKQKPNALVPLTLSTLPDGSYAHPYAHELIHLEENHHWSLPSSLHRSRLLSESALTWVDTEEKLVQLKQLLSTCQCFSVDLEHHSLRSFNGITALMQITTNDDDFLIDTILLKPYLHVLNSVFTNPNILKIFHGAEHDIQWLQRDFGIYVVNMFDTKQAANALELVEKSLAKLIKQYLDIDLCKSDQLSDWRIRPLPPSMINYARSDTHYLEELKDLMLTELYEKDESLVYVVFDRSREVCLTRWENIGFDSHGWKDDPILSDIPADKHELMTALWEWRDSTARSNDENINYVLPRQHLLELVKKCPKTPEDLALCLRPCPPFVLREAVEVCRLVVEKSNESVEEEEAVCGNRVEKKQEKRPMVSPIPTQNLIFHSYWSRDHSRDQSGVTDNLFKNSNFEPLSPVFKPIPTKPLISGISEKPIGSDDFVSNLKSLIKSKTATEAELLSDQDSIPSESQLSDEDDDISVVSICRSSSKVSKKPQKKKDSEEPVVSKSSKVFDDPTLFMERLEWTERKDQKRQTKNDDRPRPDSKPKDMSSRAKDFFRGRRAKRGRGRGRGRF